MDYINKNTGTLTGPLQLQSGGPWIHGAEGKATIIQYTSANSSSGTAGYPTATQLNQSPAVLIRAKTPGFSLNAEGDPDVPDTTMIPNVAWIMSYVTHLQEGGSAIDISSLVTQIQFEELQKKVEQLQADTSDLTKIRHNVTILLDYKTELEKIWVIDGGNPDGSVRNLEMI